MFCTLLLNPTRPPILPPNVRQRRQPTPVLLLQPLMSSQFPHGIISPTGLPLSLSQNTKNSLSRTESSAHLCVARLHQLSPPRPPPSLSESDSYSSTSPAPRLTDSCCLRSLAPAKRFSNMDLSFFHLPPAACRHHGSWYLPPPSYTVYFAHTSKIGRKYTHSATVVCLLLM